MDGPTLLKLLEAELQKALEGQPDGIVELELKWRGEERVTVTVNREADEASGL